MLLLSITYWDAPVKEPKQTKKIKYYKQPCEGIISKTDLVEKGPCRNKATLIRDGHMCCHSHFHKKTVEWYTDKIRIELAKIRLRMLQKQLEKLTKPERERRERLLERIYITCEPIMEDESG